VNIERILAWYRVGSSVGAVAALILANLVPLIGVLFFGWSVWNILIVYWLENGVVGFFNVLKILRAEGPVDPTSTWRMNGRPMNVVGRGAIAGFFILHYGIFWFVHGVFVLTMPLFAGIGSGLAISYVVVEDQFVNGDYIGTTPPGADMTAGFEVGAVLLAVVALGISHGVSYWFNYLRLGEYKRTSPAVQMFVPYGRLVVLHVTIIIGGMAIAFTGAPAAALAILVVLKTAMDIGFHLAEHRKASQPPGAVITV